MMLEVLRGGLHTTVQDMGRQGGQSLGIPPSGAQDGFALRIANLLVGNPTGGPLILRDDPGAAGLEITMAGLEVRAGSDLLVAVTGADMGVRCDGTPAPRWQAFLLRAGQTLVFGMATSGARAYLAVRNVNQLRRSWRAIEALDNKIPNDVQLEMFGEFHKVLTHHTMWLLSNRPRPLDITRAIADFGAGVAELEGEIESVLSPAGLANMGARQTRFGKTGVPDKLARLVAAVDAMMPGADKYKGTVPK